MTTPFQEVRSTLRDQLGVYDRLLDLARQKKKLLLEKFSTDLQAIVQREEECVTMLQSLDERRKECFELAGVAATASLEDLLQKVTEPDLKSDLWMLGTQLRDKGGDIHLINEENQRLLQQALELTQYSIKLFAQIPREVTYKPPGPDRKKPGVSALIDRKV